MARSSCAITDVELRRHTPGVSVVIPCFNQGRFLGDAIRSALQQTHSALELIVVDDGSTDDTASVTRRCPAAHVIQLKHQGTAAARVAGLRASHGEYVVFLDADDRLLPHAVATGVDCLDAHPDWAFVTGHVRLINEDGSPAGVPPQEHANGSQYHALLRSNSIWTPGAVMYRRSVLDTTGAFDPAGGASEDYELNIRIARRFSFGCHHHVILEYRRHGANMSADVALMLKSAMSVRRSQRKHLRDDPAAEHALRTGIEEVQADYGARLVERVKCDLRTPGFRWRAVTAMVCLLRYYPSGVTTLVRDGVRRLLGSRPHAPLAPGPPRD